MASARCDLDVAKLVHNLEFENQEYVKEIEKEKEQISVLEKQISEVETKITDLQQATSQLDSDTKLHHRQFTQNRANVESLKKTAMLLSEQEHALKMRKEIIVAEGKRKDDEHAAIEAKYSNILDDYMKKYKSFPLAKALEEATEALKTSEERLHEAKSKRDEVKEKIEARHRESGAEFQPYMTEVELGIKIAELKVSSGKIRSEIKDVCSENEDLERLIHTIITENEQKKRKEAEEKEKKLMIEKEKAQQEEEKRRNEERLKELEKKAKEQKDREEEQQQRELEEKMKRAHLDSEGKEGRDEEMNRPSQRAPSWSSQFKMLIPTSPRIQPQSPTVSDRRDQQTRTSVSSVPSPRQSPPKMIIPMSPSLTGRSPSTPTSTSTNQRASYTSMTIPRLTPPSPSLVYSSPNIASPSLAPAISPTLTMPTQMANLFLPASPVYPPKNASTVPVSKDSPSIKSTDIQHGNGTEEMAVDMVVDSPGRPADTPMTAKAPTTTEMVYTDDGPNLNNLDVDTRRGESKSISVVSPQNEASETAQQTKGDGRTENDLETEGPEEIVEQGLRDESSDGKGTRCKTPESMIRGEDESDYDPRTPGGSMDLEKHLEKIKYMQSVSPDFGFSYRPTQDETADNFEMGGTESTQSPGRHMFGGGDSFAFNPAKESTTHILQDTSEAGKMEGPSDFNLGAPSPAAMSMFGDGGGFSFSTSPGRSVFSMFGDGEDTEPSQDEPSSFSFNFNSGENNSSAGNTNFSFF